MSVARRLPAWALVTLVVLGFALVSWSVLTRTAPEGGYDGKAYVDYARVLDESGRLPTTAETYEFSIPPLFPLLAVYAQRAVDALSPPAVVDGTGAGQRLAWLLLAVGAVLLLALARSRRSRAAGAVLAAAAGLWAVLDVTAWSAGVDWSAGALLGLACGCGSLVVTWLLAREVWPERPRLAVLAVLATAAVPVSVRMAAMFHPDTQLAFLGILSLYLLVRARRRGWPALDGLWLGGVLGAAALTRQSAPILIVALALAALLDGRRPLRLLAVTAVAVALVAGPWWAYQYHRYGNPIQANLERPELLLDDEPRTFWIAWPLPDLVTRPYRESLRNELLPMFHAELWSDWFGLYHDRWLDRPRSERFLASTQSSLGLFFDLAAIGGLLGFGIPALRRVLRRAETTACDYPAAAALVFAALAWAAYVATLVRFPQRDGDPIKSSYLAFLAPVFVTAAVAAGAWLWRRGTAWRIAVVCWCVLYAVSYAGFLATAF